MNALFKSSLEWLSQKWNAAEGIQKHWERILTQKKWLSFQSHQPSVWYHWPKPTRALPKGTGVSHLESYHLHPFPGNQRWHFQSWIQTSDLRNVGYYAVDWKKSTLSRQTFSQSWFPSSACFYPRGTSSRSFPFQSWRCQLPAEVRVKVCSSCQGNLGMCYISWMLEMQRSFLWRLFLSVIACYNVWAQRGVQKLSLAKYFPAF